MIIANNYKWEAEKKDGTIINSGDDLSECVRFTLKPNIKGLPQHDIVGVKMVRRFCRGFISVGNKKSSSYVHCVVGDKFRIYVNYSTGGALVSPVDYELYL